MSLEKEKIIANTKKYFDTATKLGFNSQEFTDFEKRGARFLELCRRF